MEKVLDWIITIIFVLAMVAIAVFIFRGVQNMMNEDGSTAEVTHDEIDDYADEDDISYYEAEEDDDTDLIGKGDGAAINEDDKTIAAKDGKLPEGYDNMTDTQLEATLAKEAASAKKALSDVGSGLSGVASSLKDGVKDGVTNVKDGAIDGVKTVKDGAVDGAKAIKDKVVGAKEKAKTMVDEDGFDFSDDDEKDQLAAKGETPKKKKTTNTSSSKGSYLVMAGVFSTQANADKQMTFLRKKGCDAPESAKFGGAWGKITVVASRHKTESAARKHVKELKGKGVDCYVHKKRAK